MPSEERIQLLPESELSPPTSFSSSSAYAAWNLWKDAYRDPLTLINEKPAVRQYYESQNSLLEEYAQISNCYPSPSESQQDYTSNAIYMSNVANVILLLTQTYVTFASFSLAMLAVLIDAALDTISGAVILVTWHWRRRKDITRYPVGRARLEPLGVIALACLMTAATLLSLEQSISTLFSGEQNVRLEGFTWLTGGLLAFALLTKGCLYIYCKTISHDGVQALAQDHFNDCLANSMSFITVLIAQHAVWWVDPVGGIIIACLILRNWFSHTIEHYDQLLGRVADNQILNVITFITLHHNEKILLVDTVRAYHVGSGIYVEVDIVLPEEMELREAHDVGESLQKKIEEMEPVERCFVHLDTDAIHSPTTEHKQV